jgi:hypothetical protein
MRILADYRLRHLINNVAIHMITLEWRLLYCRIDTVKITAFSNHKPGILNNYIRINNLTPCTIYLISLIEGWVKYLS